ncbi:Inosine/uridine-preferring nucleoside hydrolase domain-containing protein [Cyathus striatus]|nr:Inosine/uridine-preferring nucleoside hydrolase domain-containing protein [Cyathus striatus]
MKYVWLDADPGHDDATAIMLAVQCPNIHLLGVSTVHGNASSEWTLANAARCLVAFGASENVLVYPGAEKPLLLEARHDPEIHGVDGLGGVEGLPDTNDPAVHARFAKNEDGLHIKALEGMSMAIKDAWKMGAGHKVTVVSSGPMTNIALFASVYPELLEAVEEFVFMGGGVGMGNRSSAAEFNILCDPHATQIVLNANVKTTMIPINVTHTAIVTREIHAELLSPGIDANAENRLPPASSNLRHTLSTLISFFAESYKSTFGFAAGPPLHDALTLAYVSQPELFRTKRYRVDAELTGAHTIGETVVDIWNYRSCDNSWGRNGKNCLVAEYVDVKRVPPLAHRFFANDFGFLGGCLLPVVFELRYKM